MGRLQLIIGPPGSGKTRRLLGELAAEAAREPLGPPAAPPLVLLVPEQQAAQMERAVLEAIAGIGVSDVGVKHASPQLSQSSEWGEACFAPTSYPAVNSRVQILSFRWLARKLELAAGQPRGELSSGGRRLLVWKLLGELDPAAFADDNVRAETATLLARLLGELAQCGATAEQLASRAAALGASQPQLASKASLLAELARRFAEHCAREGLHFSSPPARIPELLREEHWPLLAGTRVWIDGFSTFTPAEELALAALLKHCESVTASLLLDPARLDGPVASDLYDWYAPTRAQFARWGELAAAAGAEFDPARDVLRLEEPRRWVEGAALRVLAGQGLQRVGAHGCAPAVDLEDRTGAQPCSPTVDSTVSATVCADERGEAVAAAREIRRLVAPRELGGAGLRYGQVSVALRSLEPYAELLELAFAEHGIPCFIDRRAGVAHHPACELLRAGLRLALGCAEREDAPALLKCGLLGLDAADGEGAGRSALRRRADLLENYARAVALPPGEWIADAPWSRWPASDDEADHAAELAELDGWRRALLAPVIALREAMAALAPAERSVRAVLEQAWRHLYPAHIRQELAAWSEAAAAQGNADQAELHAKVLQPLAGLLDEIVALAGELAVADAKASASAYPHTIQPKELCRWVEDGLRQLSLGFPPPRLDSVLVTDIKRGRHHEVAATLLLGLADDCWPPPARQGAYFSDTERALLNGAGSLLPTGSVEETGAEPYLALVACTRPTQHLWLSRPAADSDGRGRAPSPFYSGVLAALGIAEQTAGRTAVPLSSVATADDLVIAAAQAPQDAALQSAALACGSPAALRGLHWARSRSRPAPLPAELTGRLLAPELDVRQLEDLARCPFRHFTRQLLGLEAPAQPSRQAQLARFYRRLLARTLALLRERLYDWELRPVEPVREAAAQALGELGARLAQHGDGALHQLARADWLLARICAEIAAQPAGRRPELIGGGYGSGRRLDPISVETPRGPLRLRGTFDRVDVENGTATVVALRLKTGADALHWPRFLAGAELQLPAALLALRGQRVWDAGSGGTTMLAPGNAELQRIEPHWQDDAARFGSAPLRPAYSRASDNAKVDGLLDGLLAETERILGELAQRALDGEVAPLPLRCGSWTACAGCEMRPVCRFDPAAGDEYRVATGSPAELRNRIATGESFAGSALAAAKEGAQ